MGTYTNAYSVEEYLRSVTGRVVISEEEPTADNDVDVSYKTVDATIKRVEAEIATRLSRFYDTPLRLSNANTINVVQEIANRLAAYRIWTMIHHTMTIDELPASVTIWKEEAETMLQSIVPKGKESAVEGRDVILQGETLRVAGGDPAVPNFTITKKLPWGGEES